MRLEPYKKPIPKETSNHNNHNKNSGFGHVSRKFSYLLVSHPETILHIIDKLASTLGREPPYGDKALEVSIEAFFEGDHYEIPQRFACYL